MAWSFNPFTGNLDLTGSSGAVVFEGEVETFADLSETIGDPPVGSSYLVRTSTGVWLVNKRQSGIWIRRNNTGVRATDWEYGGDYPVNSVAGKTGNVTLTNSDISGLGSAATANLNAISDADLRIVGSTDATKKVAIEVDSLVSAGTTRTITVPNKNVTLDDASDARTPLYHEHQTFDEISSALQDNIEGIVSLIGAAPLIHTHAAADVTSGVFDNARVNFAAPAAIGSTTPAAATFTNLTANTRVNLPNTNGTTAGDLYRNADTLRYRDSSNTERLLLNATDNLANLSNTTAARSNLGLGSAAVSASTDFAAASHNHAASAITSGVLDNARINFAAPSAIGSTTASTGAFTTLTASSTVSGTGFSNYLASPPAIGGTSAAAGSFTTLSASTLLTLGTSGILSGGTNTIEQRNTTSAQTFRIYNTVSGAADANYERGFMRWSSNVLQIGTEKAGTGSARNLEFYTDNTFRARFQAEGLVLSSNSSVVYFGSPYIAGSAESNFSLDLVPFGSGNVIVRSGLLKFHGTTSSFPALKRSSTALQVRLADDSAFAPLSCGALTLNGNLDASTKDLVTDTTTGTKIGTGTTQKLGFFNATPIVRPAAIADATDAATTQARLNDLLAAMRSLGLIAT